MRAIAKGQGIGPFVREGPLRTTKPFVRKGFLRGRTPFFHEGPLAQGRNAKWLHLFIPRSELPLRTTKKTFCPRRAAKDSS